jgi:hypothetical protein
MPDESNTSNPPQDPPDWIADTLIVALIVAAAICLITSVGLAVADKVAAGTLTAGLFVACVLFLYLPQMKSFKAFGIAVEFLKEVGRLGAELEKSGQKLKAKQLAAHAPKEEVEKFDKALTKLSTANNEISAYLTALDLTAGSPRLGSPTVRIIDRKSTLPRE